MRDALLLEFDQRRFDVLDREGYVGASGVLLIVAGRGRTPSRAHQMQLGGALPLAHEHPKPGNALDIRPARVRFEPEHAPVEPPCFVDV